MTQLDANISSQVSALTTIVSMLEQYAKPIIGAAVLEDLHDAKEALLASVSARGHPILIYLSFECFVPAYEAYSGDKLPFEFGPDDLISELSASQE